MGKRTPIRWSRVADEGPIIVSYFTDAYYMREAFELARSCQLFDLSYVIEEVPDQKSWSGNTGHKPQFLLEKHKAFPNRPLVWLDADARVRTRPHLFRDMIGAVAYHIVQKHPLSGTVYLGVNPNREEFLKVWRHQVAINPTKNDQVCMGIALDVISLSKDYPFEHLPASYCWIYDYDGIQPTDRLTLDNTPVIEHMQASRWSKELKKRVPK